jgi:hypothetical protein
MLQCGAGGPVAKEQTILHYQQELRCGRAGLEDCVQE